MLMDLYSRKIIGWTIDLTMTQRLVLAALQDAIRQRQPCLGPIHHSDRGGQHAGTEYRDVISRAQTRQSMSRAGDCYDNAFMESCFGTIKVELEMTCYQSPEHARRELEEYINYCNAIRRHSSRDYQSASSWPTRVKGPRLCETCATSAPFNGHPKRQPQSNSLTRVWKELSSCRFSAPERIRVVAYRYRRQLNPTL